MTTGMEEERDHLNDWLTSLPGEIIDLNPRPVAVSVDMGEKARRQAVADVNMLAAERETLKKRHGLVWDTNELGRDFAVEGFAAPYCVVTRRSDGKRGVVCFQHHPRFFFSFKPELD